MTTNPLPYLGKILQATSNVQALAGIDAHIRECLERFDAWEEDQDGACFADQLICMQDINPDLRWGWMDLCLKQSTAPPLSALKNRPSPLSVNKTRLPWPHALAWISPNQVDRYVLAGLEVGSHTSQGVSFLPYVRRASYLEKWFAQSKKENFNPLISVHDVAWQSVMNEVSPRSTSDLSEHLRFIGRLAQQHKLNAGAYSSSSHAEVMSVIEKLGGSAVLISTLKINNAADQVKDPVFFVEMINHFAKSLGPHLGSYSWTGKQQAPAMSIKNWLERNRHTLHASNPTVDEAWNSLLGTVYALTMKSYRHNAAVDGWVKEARAFFGSDNPSRLPLLKQAYATVTPEVQKARAADWAVAFYNNHKDGPHDIATPVSWAEVKQMHETGFPVAQSASLLKVWYTMWKNGALDLQSQDDLETFGDVLKECMFFAASNSFYDFQRHYSFKELEDHASGTKSSPFALLCERALEASAMAKPLDHDQLDRARRAQRSPVVGWVCRTLERGQLLKVCGDNASAPSRKM